MKKRYLIDALFINSGGGQNLLEYLIDFVVESNVSADVFFLFDDRLDSKKIEKLESEQYKFLKSGLLNRLLFYLRYFRLYECFICFGNVPPPIVINRKSVTVYFQNILLLDSQNKNIKWNERILLRLKRIYLLYVNRGHYNWAVQTSVVSNLLIDKLGVEQSKISILPIFLKSFFLNINVNIPENNFNYLYVANAAPHKNHIKFLEAWFLFVQMNQNKPYTLHLTLDGMNSSSLLSLIEEYNRRGCKILNHGSSNLDQIKYLYSCCNFLVYPSLGESFGLPLAEAASAGCKIISSDLPYVFSVVNPSLVFDPYNVASILDALILSCDINNLNPTTLVVDDKIEYLF
jgi:glycosyltransferase involved in cell wall biosynthesis